MIKIKEIRIMWWWKVTIVAKTLRRSLKIEIVIVIVHILEYNLL
jgi:hypothetical protein